jgi:hypothetical protein
MDLLCIGGATVVLRNMRILHTLLWAFVALACAAPTCDTHDGTLGSGSESSATSTSTGSAKQHEDVVRAMESVTGAKLGHPASTTKPTKSKSSTVHSDDGNGGGNYGRSQAPSPPPPPPKPRLPESGRRIGQACEDHEQCASDQCDFDRCTQKSGTKLSKGEKCDYQSDCTSNRCSEDKCD